MALLFLSIGSNKGEALENVNRAIRLIDAGMPVVGRSKMYKTEPQANIEQAWFVNTAISVETNLSPERALAWLNKIEDEMGRKRDEKWGPRVIDIDILFYDDLVITGESLTIPHPSAHARRFVLAPVADIAPNMTFPGKTKSVAQLLAEAPVEGQAIREIAG